MIVVTVDIGTNTALLLVADVEDGHLAELQRERKTVRLGEGLDASGTVSQAALSRLRDALSTYRTVISSYDVDRLVVTGTSASRDASNKEDLHRVVRETLGVELQIVGGEVEAALAFVASVDEDDGFSTVVDIGGGSTELVHGRLKNGKPQIQRAESFNVGSVRLTERFGDGQPLSSAARDRMEGYIQDVFSAVQRYPAETRLVGSGGTATTAALLIRGLDRKPDSANKIVVTTCEIESLFETLAGLSFEDVYAISPVLMEGRADVLPAGLIILNGVMRQFGFDELAVSFRGLRHGVALKAADMSGDGTFDL